MHMNIEQATNLVTEATTQDKIEFALYVFNYPATNAVKLDITEYQTSMMIEQLNINSCNLEVNGFI